jgi:hypothetical protein
MEIASKMFFKTEIMMRPAVLLFLCFTQLGSINGNGGKLIIILYWFGLLLNLALLLKM